jgi:hypothetical protein
MAFSLHISADTNVTFSKYVDQKGTISLPKDFRVSWVHLGSWFVPDEKAAGYGFHDVYTQEEAVQAFKKTGKFPDGAVLVKEIRGIESAQMTTGNASWAANSLIWFVMIKDEKGRFPDSPNWGSGWGWALFKAPDTVKNVSADFQKDCIPCHLPVQKSDWVYLQGYPTLK